jgi:hypothetical protein
MSVEFPRIWLRGAHRLRAAQLDIAPLVARYTDRLAPGSYLALSHVVTDVRTFADPTFAYAPENPAPGIWMLCAAGRKR